MCAEHGGAKTCKVPNCEKLDRGRGFCSKHGNLLGVGPGACEVDACDKRAVSGGRCAEHGDGKRCAAKGCQKMAKVEGKCRIHAEEGGAGRGV